MSSQFLLSIDQGTTSTRTALFSKEGALIGMRQKELSLFTPQNGWVEQNPEDIWQDTLWTMQTLVKDYPVETAQICGIGITNQRETTILWDRNTGKPIYNAIVWQDRRTAALCETLKETGVERMVSEKTGLLLDPYFSATKIAWILDNVEGARVRAEAGTLAFGTVDSFLLWRLTKGRVHKTDATNASRTMLYNIRENKWDDELLSLFNIPRALLPDVCDNVHPFGEIDISIIGKTHMVGAMVGDQQAALIGQACIQKGMVKSTYGTGCFALMNIGSEFCLSSNRLLTTIGYRINGKTIYAIEGAIFVAGAAIQWLRDALHFFKDANETQRLASAVDDTDGVYFVPAFTGLGAPYWNPDARGVISGLNRGTTASHIIRAALEAQAYQTQDLMGSFFADTGCTPDIIRADGGLVTNHFMCQFLADILDKPVEVPQTIQTTAFGVAFLAGLQAGIYESLEKVSDICQTERRYTPSMNKLTRDKLYGGWSKIIKGLLHLK